MKKEDFVFNEQFNYYEKEFANLFLTIETDKIDRPDVLDYANHIVNAYPEQKEKLEKYLLDESLREYYGDDNSDDEIIMKLGKPTIEITNAESCKFMWMDSTLDEHLITLEVVDKYGFSYVTIEG